jgi:hypothetical protein
MRAPRVIAAGRWRRRLTATLALVIAIAVVIAVILGTESPSSLKAATGNHNQSSGSTTVRRRDLVQTDTESGTLSYAGAQTVYNRLSGTITWLPAVGQVIKPGQALYRVDGAPVILMDGTTPAYRDLNSSDSDGPDILQLNRNLVRLGFNPDGIVVDDVWQAATTAGVELYQASLGETETGSIALGKIVFLPGAQLISTVDATVGSDGSGGSNPSGSSASYEPSATPAAEFVDLQTSSTPTSPAPASPSPTTPKKKHKPHQNQSAQTITTLKALLKAATAQLQAETAQLRASQNGSGKNGGSPNGGNSGKSPSSSGSGSNNSGNSNNNSGNSNNGSGGGSATAILATTSTKLVVTVDLDATKQSEAKVGEPVTVELPNGNTVNGRVTAVSPIAQSSSNNGNNGNGGNGNNGNGGNGNGNGSSGATIPVTVGLTGHQAGAGLDQAAVSVNFAEAKASNVLSVPVTALLATAGGGYAVQEAAAPHTLIPVTTGLFAAGYVEISGPGIYPGLAVTDSQG